MLENNFSATSGAGFNFSTGLIDFSESTAGKTHRLYQESLCYLANKVTEVSDVYLIKSDNKTILVVRSGIYSVYEAADRPGGIYIVAGDDKYFLTSEEFRRLEIIDGTISERHYPLFDSQRSV